MYCSPFVHPGLGEGIKKKRLAGFPPPIVGTASSRDTHSVCSMKRQRKEKGYFLSFFSLMKRSKNHPTTELAKNLMYSLNLPILPQPVEDF